MADELFMHCRPGEGILDAARQAEALYEALFAALAREGAGPEAIVSETVFLRRIREHCEVARRARYRVIGAAGLEAGRRDHPTPCATRHLAVLPYPSNEHALADDGLGSRAFRSKRGEQGLVERFGLLGRIQDPLAWPAVDKQLIGHGAAEPAKSDQRFARPDPTIGSPGLHRGRFPP